MLLGDAVLSAVLDEVADLGSLLVVVDGFFAVRDQMELVQAPQLHLLGRLPRPQIGSEALAQPALEVPVVFSPRGERPRRSAG